MESVSCVLMASGASPPDIGGQPFRAVIVIEDEVTDEWRDLVSKWLVGSGCLYMMAWGQGCTKWDDSVDHANLAEFDWGDIPDDKFVMTTWHESEALEETFWFAKFSAFHPTVSLPRLVIVHVANEGRCDELVKLYEQQVPVEDDE